MKQLVFSVYDEKATLYGKPIFLSTRGEAMRCFGDEVGKGSSLLNSHPEDFKLYCLGEFDDNSGELLPFKLPEYLTCGVDFVNK